MVEGLRRQSVCLDHERDRRRFDRDLHVVEVDLGEVGELHPRRLDQRLGRGPAEALVELGVQRAGVDPDADGDAAVLGLLGHLLDLGLLAQVAGVEAQALHSGLQGGERHLVVEVDVGDDRHGRARHDVGQALGRLLLVARAAHDVGPGRRQRVDLGQGAFDVRGLRDRHRLHRDRSAAADRDGPDVDLAGGSARRCDQGGTGHQGVSLSAGPGRCGPVAVGTGLLERVLHRVRDVEVQRRDDDEAQQQDEGRRPPGRAC